MGTGIGLSQHLVQIPTVPFPGCVTWGESLVLPESFLYP